MKIAKRLSEFGASEELLNQLEARVGFTLQGAWVMENLEVVCALRAVPSADCRSFAL